MRVSVEDGRLRRIEAHPANRAHFYNALDVVTPPSRMAGDLTAHRAGAKLVAAITGLAVLAVQLPPRP